MKLGSKPTRLVSLASTALMTTSLLWAGAIAGAPPSVGSAAPVSLAAASATSPPGKMVVVSTNLRAAWNDQSDMPVRMTRYVDRLLNQTPYYPDVLLLQEVKGQSADKVASLLSSKTGDHYVVAVRPPNIPWRSTPRVRTELDSGIVINRTTTKKVGKGGYISLTFKRSDMSDKSVRREINKHARASVREIHGGLKLAVASVHFQYQLLKHWRWGHYEKLWANKVSHSLAVHYPGVIRTVSGDFNRTRCLHPGSGSPSVCKKSPFWNTFVAGHQFRDSIYKVWRGGRTGLGLGGVDFIFTRGNPTNADSDTSYNKKARSEFYSDHRFVWATISAS